MRLSQKQVEILKVIAGNNLDESLIDITQLRQSVSYTATKQAVLCSVNHLVKRNLIERIGRESRNGSVCTTLAITSEGRVILNAYSPSLKSILIEDDFDELDEIFV